MKTITAGKHWAICHESSIDPASLKTYYVQGHLAATEADAERYYRDWTGLRFIGVKIRRTTEEEDRRLELGRADIIKAS